jgi:hypothetical protein
MGLELIDLFCARFERVPRCIVLDIDDTDDAVHGQQLALHELRGAAPKRSIWRTAAFETIRCAFLKIAVRIQELKTRIKMALPSAYPHVQALTALATSIAARAP